jgi:hypothetical protein
MRIVDSDRCPECRSKLVQDTVNSTRVCDNCGQLVASIVGQNNAARLANEALQLNTNEDTIELRRDALGFTNPNLHRRQLFCLCELEWECPTHGHVGPCDCNPPTRCNCHLQFIIETRNIEESLAFVRGMMRGHRIPPSLGILEPPYEIVYSIIDMLAFISPFMDGDRVSIDADIDEYTNEERIWYCVWMLEGLRFRLLSNSGGRLRPVAPCINCGPTGACGDCQPIWDDGRGEVCGHNEGYRLGIYSNKSYMTTQVFLHEEEQIDVEVP